MAVFETGLEQARGGRLRAQSLREDEPLRTEWDVCVVGPHFAGALVARDLERPAERDEDRLFEYTVAYDRDLAIHCARLFLARVEPPDGALRP